jgi:hypothetical protein
MQAADEHPVGATTRPARSVRAAGALFALLGVGFGVPSLWAVEHLQRMGELPMTPFGFRALSGPFEQLGPTWFSRLGVALAGVSGLYLLAGVWLWRGERRGLRLGAAAAAPGLVLGAGFALPLLLIGLPVSLLLALSGRRSLRD